MGNKARRLVSLVLVVGLFFQQAGFAQAAGALSLAGYLNLSGSSAISQDKFRPVQMRYFSYEPASDNFKILLDKGDLNKLEDKKAKEEAQTLLNYFLVGVTLPDDIFWVNLRPDSQDQIIDPLLEKTEVGRIMLAADLQLKKDTSRMTSPQTPEGKAYWDKLYKKAGELFGTENITIPTITRPWIVPGEIIVRESQNSAYVYKAGLKVMLEEDYLSRGGFEPAPTSGGSRTAPTHQQYAFSDPRFKELNQYSTQLIKELIIPKLTKEINSSKRYASLRQVYYSLILSRWFKLRFAGKSGTYASLINTGNLTNLISNKPWDKGEYFNQYQQSFAKGEYNLKEQVYTPTGQSVRSYVSGGVNWASSAINTQNGAIFPGDNLYNKPGMMEISGSANSPLGIGLQPAAQINILPVPTRMTRGAIVEANSLDEREKLVKSILTKFAVASPLQNKVDIERYRNKLQPILRNAAGGKFKRIQMLDQNGELSKIFPIMGVLKTKIKDKQTNVSVFDHTLGLIKELSLIEDDNFPAFAAVIDKSGSGQFKIDAGLFNKYRKILKEIVQNEEDRELIYLITLLHDVGEAEKTPGHPQISATMVKSWLQGILSQEQIDKAEAVIRSHVDLGTLYFAERTPAYLSSQASLGNRYSEYVKTLSLLTFLDAGDAITKKKAEFYLDIAENIGAKKNLKEDFYERRKDQYSSYREKKMIEEKKDESKFNEVKKELENLKNLISSDENNKFEKAIRGDIEVFDYGIFFFRGLSGKSLVKMLYIAHKLTEGRNITRVNFSARSGIAPTVAVFIDVGILEYWEMKDIVELSFDTNALKEELKLQGIDVQDKVVQVFGDKEETQLVINNLGYYEAKLAELKTLSKQISETISIVSPLDLKKALELFRIHLRALKKALALNSDNKVNLEQYILVDKVIDGIRQDRGKQAKDTKFVKKFKGELTDIVSEDGEVVGVTEVGFAHMFGLKPEQQSSSSLIQSMPDKKTGGIDFRSLPMSIQPMGSFRGLDFGLPRLSRAEIEGIDVQSQIGQIKNMVSSGISPSGRRVKELVAVCAQKGQISAYADDLLACIGDILKLEEEIAKESSPELKEALVIAEWV